jgi:hypothetical protein
MLTRYHRRRFNLPRHGRTALAWGLLLFAAGQLTLALVEQYQPVLRDPEYGYRSAFLHALVAAHPERPLLLVTGSSRVTTGFRPEILPQLRTPDGQQALVFNCAIPASGAVRELLYLRRLLAEGLRPRWLVVEAWPPLLHANMGEGEVANLDVNRLDWRDLRLLRRYTPKPHSLHRRWWKSWLLPALSTRFALLTECTPDWMPPSLRRIGTWLTMDPTGWLPQPVPPDPREVEKIRAGARQGCMPLVGQYRLSACGDRALRDILALCRHEHIAAFLLFMPEASGLRNTYDPATVAVFARYLDGLSREFRVPVIDTRRWVGDDGFLDGFHLLPRGATAFTRRFGREVLRPLVMNQPLPPPQILLNHVSSSPRPRSRGEGPGVRGTEEARRP